jgi:hypothetical protein
MSKYATRYAYPIDLTFRKLMLPSKSRERYLQTCKPPVLVRPLLLPGLRSSRPWLLLA